MRSKFKLATVLALLAMPLTGHAITLQVDCDTRAEKPATIGAALHHLKELPGNVGPNTIEVSGACKENIAVASMTNLTITARNGASITDASGGTLPVINLTKTTNFSLVGFAIRGGGGPLNSAIACLQDSTCYFSNNDIQHPTGTAIIGALGASVWLNHDILENSVTGLSLLDASRAVAFSAVIRNNSSIGVGLNADSFLTTNFSTSIENNAGGGVFIFNHSSAQITATSITGNGGVGVFAAQGSEVLFFPPLNTISGNIWGVAVQDLSWANFSASSAAVSGSTNQPDIQCWGHFSGATTAAAAGSTNCAP